MYIFSIAFTPTPVNKFIKSVYLMNTFDFGIFFLIHCNALDYNEFAKKIRFLTDIAIYSTFLYIMFNFIYFFDDTNSI